MAALTWIICAAALLSSASPALCSTQVVQVVQPGQNVSLSCNFTSTDRLTWYLLRSDQLLPLLTVEWSRIIGHVMSFENADSRRVGITGSLKDGRVDLELLQVEEEDAGIYFCSWQLHGKLLTHRGIHLNIQGSRIDGAERGGSAWLPCWTLGICVLPALLVSCIMFIVGLCVYSGKRASVSRCCCRDTDGLKTAEDASLYYSSLRHVQQPSRPRPGPGPGPGGTGLVKEEVTYSTVARHQPPH